MIRTGWTIGLLATAIALPGIASAQVRASGTVPVSVRLEIAPDPPLNVLISRPLSFGTVRIPNRLKIGTICNYQLEFTGGMTVTETPDTNTASAPVTRSGCAQSQAGNSAQVNIRCDQSRLVSVALSTQQATIPNLSYVMSSVRVGRNSLDRNSFVCLDNITNIFIGGTLTVGQDYTLPVGQALEVATITVSVSYL